MANESIHMGHGQMVDLVDRGAGRWELVFSEAGKPDYKAPPLAEVKVEAIDDAGAVHELTVSDGPSVSTVALTGRTEGARCARIMVRHGTHFHTRETTAPGAAPIEVRRGPSGGALIALDDGEVEVTKGAGRWTLRFHSGDAPAADTVTAEAIGPCSQDYQVRQLLVLPGPDAATLIASGRVDDATHIRLAVARGTGVVTRSLPVA